MSAIVRRIPRRRMLGMLAAPAVLAPGSARGFRLFNPCLAAVLPEPLASHEIVARAFDGIDPTEVIDAHVHLLGDDRGANGTEGRVRGTGGETGGTGTDDGGRGAVAGNGTSGGTGMDNDGDDGPWIGEQIAIAAAQSAPVRALSRLSQCELRPPRGRETPAVHSSIAFSRVIVPPPPALA